jgi:hypothetical protein
MILRIDSINIFALAVAASSAVTIAWSQDAKNASEPAKTATLALAAELPAPRPEEERFTQLLVQGTVGDLMKQTGSPVKRDQHPKHHGCVRATFTIADGLPDALKVGIFREPKTYDAVVRFSNARAQVDNIPDAHGMAIKLLGVDGPSLLKDEADAGTQDFILIDHPVFFAIDPKNLVEFTGARKELAEAKAAGDTAKATATFERFRLQFSILQNMAKLGTPSPLEMTFHSEVPYKFGERAVKYSAVPGPENMSGRSALTQASPDDALRDAMVEHLTTKKKPATFIFQIRLQADPVKMPVEDPTILWETEPIKVATLTIRPHEFARPAQMEFCENLSLSPWHSLEAHCPIGGINRARKMVYEATSKFRHEKNQVPRKEPTIVEVNRLYGMD